MANKEHPYVGMTFIFGAFLTAILLAGPAGWLVASNYASGAIGGLTAAVVMTGALVLQDKYRGYVGMSIIAGIAASTVAAAGADFLVGLAPLPVAVFPASILGGALSAIAMTGIWIWQRS